MSSEGFLGTAAPLSADAVLLSEIAMGVGLLVGAWLARKRRFREHARCQSFIVLLNLAVIGVMMVPSFRVGVLPGIPAKLGKTYYALATVHAALGTIGEILALYILVSAGTNILPKQVRIIRYRMWMRSVLAIWWVALLLGIATYSRWYIPRLF